jgi:copper chaperone CopZ
MSMSIEKCIEQIKQELAEVKVVIPERYEAKKLAVQILSRLDEKFIAPIIEVNLSLHRSGYNHGEISKRIAERIIQSLIKEEE